MDPDHPKYDWQNNIIKNNITALGNISWNSSMIVNNPADRDKDK